MRSESWNPLLKSYPDSEKINAVSIGAETFYTRLIAQTDDAGHYSGDPKWILAKLFTGRMITGTVSIKDVEKWIKELIDVGLIVAYTNNGNAYIEIVDCKKCLRSDRKPEIRFPYREGDPKQSASDDNASVVECPTSDGQSGVIDPYQTKTQTHLLPREEEVEELVRLGVSRARAEAAVARKSSEEIAEIVAAMDECRKKFGIKSPNGLLKTILRDGVSRPSPKQECAKAVPDEPLSKAGKIGRLELLIQMNPDSPKIREWKEERAQLINGSP